MSSFKFKTKEVFAKSRAKRYSEYIYEQSGGFSDSSARSCALEALFDTLYDETGEIKGIYARYPIAINGGASFYSGENPLLPSIFLGLPIDGTTLYWQDGILKSAGSGAGLSSVRVNLGSVGYDSVDGVVNLPAYPTDALTLGGVAAANYWHNGNAGTVAHDWAANQLTVANGILGQIYPDNSILYGRAGFQFSQSHLSGTGENGNAPELPQGNNWHSNLILNHSNAAGYYQQLSFDFFANRLFYKTVSAGVSKGFVELWHTGNSGTVLSDWTARSLNLKYIKIECNANGVGGSNGAEINTYNVPLQIQQDSTQDLWLCNGGGRVGIKCQPATDYALDVNGGEIRSRAGWFRNVGARGWYNESYGGGIYMEDATWVRVYNNKSFYVPSALQVDGESLINGTARFTKNMVMQSASRIGFGPLNDFKSNIGPYWGDNNNVGLIFRTVKSAQEMTCITMKPDGDLLLGQSGDKGVVSVPVGGVCKSREIHNYGYRDVAPSSISSKIMFQNINNYQNNNPLSQSGRIVFSLSTQLSGSYDSTTEFMRLDAATNTCTINGNLSVSLQVSCRNTVHTQGAAFYTSDMRKKSVIDHIDLSLLQIANAPVIRFAWKNGDGIGVGGSAQYTESLIPELVMDTANGKVMDYATTAYMFSVNVAKELYKFESDTDRRIRELETEVERLKRKRYGSI